jgi:hypothetical protein
MKPRADRPPIARAPGAGPRQPSATAVAVRARKHRRRRKAGVRCFMIEMSEPDLQAVAKAAPQADPAVERTIRAVLSAAYGTHRRDRERPIAEPGSEGSGDVCPICGTPGILWKGLTPCSYGGKTFNAHPRCFAALTAGARGPAV